MGSDSATCSRSGCSGSDREGRSRTFIDRLAAAPSASVPASFPLPTVPRAERNQRRHRRRHGKKARTGPSPLRADRCLGSRPWPEYASQAEGRGFDPRRPLRETAARAQPRCCPQLPLAPGRAGRIRASMRPLPCKRRSDGSSPEPGQRTSNPARGGFF